MTCFVAKGYVVRVEIYHQEEEKKYKMTSVVKWVHLSSAEVVGVVGVAQGMRMFYTMVLTLQDALQRYVAVKTIFCFPGNIQCQINAGQTNHESLLLSPIQLQMNLHVPSTH